jgi:hypothetical protein
MNRDYDLWREIDPMLDNNANIRRQQTALAAIGIAALLGMDVPANALEIKEVKDPAGNAMTLELNGKFEPGDGLKLRAEVAKLPPEMTITIHFNAAGGNFTEGMSIGRFIHQLSIKTVVPAKAKCYSPCPLAFFAASDAKGASAAIKHTTGYLGFTAFLPTAQDKDYTAVDLDNEVARTQRSILQVFDYLSEIGADPDVLRRIYEEIPEGQVKSVSDDELLSLGVSIFDDASNQLIDASAIRKRKQR